MSKPCGACKGKGHWEESRTYNLHGAEMQETVVITCGNCKGTGRSQAPEDGDDYDIGGSSIDEE